MKRRISLVIALALSFLMMFSSIAKAEEVKIQITVTTSEPGQIEVFKAPPVATNKADSPPPQVKAKDPVLQEGEHTDEQDENCPKPSTCGECMVGNAPGRCMQTPGGCLCQVCTN